MNNVCLIEKHLNELCTKIGSRPVGSQNNRNAQSYISTIFQENGFVVENQFFDCIEWKSETILLQVNKQKIPVTISPYTPSCDLSAKFEIIQNLDVLRETTLTEKIAVISGELASEPLMPKNFRFWNPDHHKEIISVLEQKRPLAILFISSTPVIEDGDFSIPSAIVAKNNEDILIAAKAETIQLKIESSREKAVGANVIARKNDHHKDKIVVCAHFDTKPDTPGALDNASGITTLLILSHMLNESIVETGIELTAFNGEDYFSAPGETLYVDTHTPAFKDITFAINCDGVGHKNSQTALSLFSTPHNMADRIKNEMAKFKKITMINPWYQGSHMIFAVENIPTMAVTSHNIFQLMENTIHTVKDTPDLVDFERINELSMFLYNMMKESFFKR